MLFWDYALLVFVVLQLLELLNKWVTFKCVKVKKK